MMITPSTSAALLNNPFDRSPVRTESTSALGIVTTHESQFTGR